MCVDHFWSCLCQIMIVSLSCILSGANWFIRKMASSSSPTLEITQQGNKFDIKLQSMVVSRESHFTVGEDFEETQQNGLLMKVFSNEIFVSLLFSSSKTFRTCNSNILPRNLSSDVT